MYPPFQELIGALGQIFLFSFLKGMMVALVETSLRAHCSGFAVLALPMSFNDGGDHLGCWCWVCGLSFTWRLITAALEILKCPWNDGCFSPWDTEQVWCLLHCEGLVASQKTLKSGCNGWEPMRRKAEVLVLSLNTSHEWHWKWWSGWWHCAPVEWWSHSLKSNSCMRWVKFWGQT